MTAVQSRGGEVVVRSQRYFTRKSLSIELHTVVVNWAASKDTGLRPSLRGTGFGL